MSGGKSQMQQTAVCYHAQLPLFLRQLAQTPPVQRLRQVGMSCGCEYTQFPPFVHSTPYLRYEHSLGVALIVWHFTGDRAQAAAGLLHDAATPAFAHVVDFLLGDHLRQEATEAGTHDVLAASAPLLSVLGRWGLPLSAVENYHQYPIADNALPRLSADRLEYTLGNLLHYGFCGAEELQGWYDDIVQAENEQGVPELAFSTPELGYRFAQAALRCSRVYVSDEDRFAMQKLAQLLRRALDMGVLAKSDLYQTEPQVIARLQTDARLAADWKTFTGYSALKKAAQRPFVGDWLQIPAKKRYIDPLLTNGKRVSQQFPQAAAEQARFLQQDLSVWLSAE